MRFKVTLKDPDALDDAISDAATEEVAAIPGLSPGERQILARERRVHARAVAGQWFRYGEYLTVEIDTEAGTATVCRDAE